jgi:hypothetical protein
MGSLPDVYKLLKEELKDTSAEVLTPDSPGYGESIKRWSEHCEKRAVCTTLYPYDALVYLLVSDLSRILFRLAARLHL